MRMTARSILLLCSVWLFVAGCAGAVAPTLPPEPTQLPTATAVVETTKPTIAPDDREYLFEYLMDAMVEVSVAQGWGPPTIPELIAACDALEKHQWDMDYDFFTDPVATVRTSTIAGTIYGGTEEVGNLSEKRGFARYHASDFCEDIRKT